MDFSKKLLTLLAIFCVIASATAVCAADVNADDGYVGTSYDGMNGVSESQNQDDGGWAGSQYQDKGDWAGSQYQDDGGWAGSQYNETLENGTHVPSAGAPTNTTGNSTTPVEHNTTANATSTSHNLLATGNPILVLLVVNAIIGGYAVLRRRK